MLSYLMQMPISQQLPYLLARNKGLCYNNKMKKIKAFFKRIFSTFTVRMSQRPVLMTVLILLGINFGILLLAAGIAIPLGLELPDGTSYPLYFYSFSVTLRWLVLPNSVLTTTEGNIPLLVLAVIVVVVGMVLFTGTIIAIITTYLRGYIGKRGEAKGKLNLSNHIVILNYNNKVSETLIDFMHAKVGETVLVLSDRTKEQVKDDLANEFAMLKAKPAQKKLKLIVRKGNPSSIAELQEIGLERAGGILIMDSDTVEDYVGNAEISAADYDIIKLVMKLSNLDISPSCQIGVDADTAETVEMIRHLQSTVPSLKNKSIQAFSHNQKLGQFLALSILCPPLSGVLTELLCYSGSSFHAIEESLNPEEYLKNYSGGIPIIESENKLYVLTQCTDLCAKKRTHPHRFNRLLPPSKLIEDTGKLKLFVIGRNRKSEYMLQVLKSENSSAEIREYEKHEVKRFCEELTSYGDKHSVALILSDDTVPPDKYDSNIFLTLIELSRLVDLQNRPFQIIAELLQPDNEKSIEELKIRNIIISTRIISFLATKLIKDAAAERFYEDIFTHSLAQDCRFDLWVKDAEYLFDFNVDVSFSSYSEFVHAAYYGSNKKIMPLGMIKDGKNIFFCTNMDCHRSLVLEKSDKIIYVEYIQ